MNTHNMAIFTYSGKVRGKGRPRFRKNGHAYTPKETAEYEAAIRAAWLESGCDGFGAAPVRVIIDVYRALPRSRPKRIASEPDTGRPDADNIAKAVLDALQGEGGAFDDDGQVVDLRVLKRDRTRAEHDQDIMCIIIQKVEGI